MHPRALRYLSAAIAALWLAAPAASAVHGALSSHSHSHSHYYCAEHRAFETVHRPAAGEPSPAAGGAAPALRTALAEAHAEHQPCALANLAHLAQTLRLEPAAASVLCLAGLEGRAPPPAPALAPGVPPLSLAPKTSPPLS